MTDETQSPGYDLSPGERSTAAGLMQQIAAAKLAVYELNCQLEKAQHERDAAEARFQGMLQFLANSHGMSVATLAPDYSRIAPPKE
jgi:hypothetical protein